MGSNVNLGLFGGHRVTASRSVYRSSSSFFLTICFFCHMLNAISTKLGQNDQWVSSYKSYQQFDLKGHAGVAGVKKVNYVKNMRTAPI